MREREREIEIYLILEPISTTMRSLHPSSPQLKEENNQKSKLPSGSFCIWKNHPTQCFRVSWPRNGVSSEFVRVYFFPCFLPSPAANLSRMAPQMRSKHQSLLPQNMERGRRGGEGEGQKTPKKKNSLGILDLSTPHSSLFFQSSDLLRKLVYSEPTHSTQKHSKLVVD